jgi:hypothetical protein
MSVSPRVLTSSVTPDSTASAIGLKARAQATTLTAADLLSRQNAFSRSTGDRRTTADRTKVSAIADRAGAARTVVEKVNSADPKALARALMPQFGLSASEFGCLDNIWSQESGWNVHADNPSSSAYGIPQALPGSKMSSAGPDWANSAETQIRWGLGYIRDRYGSACSAWGFKSGHGWY